MTLQSPLILISLPLRSKILPNLQQMVQVNPLILANLPQTSRIQQSHRIVIHRSQLIRVILLAILVIHQQIQARGQTIRHNQILPKELHLLNLLSSLQINHRTSLRILLRINHRINPLLSQIQTTLLSHHLHQQGLATHLISLPQICQPILLVAPLGTHQAAITLDTIPLVAITLEATHLEATHLDAIHQVVIPLLILRVAILQVATHLLILLVVIPQPILLVKLSQINLLQLLQPMTLQSHRHKIQLNLQQSPLLNQPSHQLKNRPKLLKSPPPNLQNLPRRSHLRLRNHPRSRQTRQLPLHRSQAGLTRSSQSGTKLLRRSYRYRSRNRRPSIMAQDYA